MCVCLLTRGDCRPEVHGDGVHDLAGLGVDDALRDHHDEDGARVHVALPGGLRSLLLLRRIRYI